MEGRSAQMKLTQADAHRRRRGSSSVRVRFADSAVGHLPVEVTGSHQWTSTAVLWLPRPLPCSLHSLDSEIIFDSNFCFPSFSLIILYMPRGDSERC